MPAEHFADFYLRVLSGPNGLRYPVESTPGRTPPPTIIDNGNDAGST